MRETKGRKGKGVTLISGVPLENKELKNLAKVGAVRVEVGLVFDNGVIEIQGDHRDVLEKELLRLGYTVKRAGG